MDINGNATMNGISIIKALTLDMRFMDNQTSIPPFGIVSSPLRITKSEKMVPDIHALPIAANMSFPSLSYVIITP